MRVGLLDIEFDGLATHQLHAAIFDAVSSGEKRVIAHHNLHSLYLFHTDLRMRQFFGIADYIHIDGMSLVYLAQLFGHRIGAQQRVTYLDWIWPLMAKCEQHEWRVFYLGGRPGVAAKAAQRLQTRYPSLILETNHGYFKKDGEENAHTLRTLRDFRPNILLVGMGMPLQEHWILENLTEIQANVILTAGACFDYIAGVIPAPPRWMGKIGLEWLFRLASEPGRLWRRYLLEPWYVVGLVVKELFRMRSARNGPGFADKSKD